MKLIPLQQVRGQMQSGMALPWGVRDNTGKLLLARGHMITSEAMLNTLVERGCFVDAEETRGATGSQPEAPPARMESFFARWGALQNRLATVLRAPNDPNLIERLKECGGLLYFLTERHPDQVIFSIIRHDHGRYATYGISHSLHVAAVCSLIARRMDWPKPRIESLIGAALTMNISIIELQGQLASRGGRPNPEQHIQIKAHPIASAAILKAAMLQDEEWLTAVEHHHDMPEGKGYNPEVQTPSEMSQFLRYIDIFTAKHAGRSDRRPVPAQQAARDLYTNSKGHPIAATLIKEFGIYPPGCFVKLASGEIAIVTRRGAAANTPLAAAITNRNGDPLINPIRRETGSTEFSIIATVAENAVMVRVPVEKLYPESESNLSKG